jgi:hypothetical protein
MQRKRDFMKDIIEGRAHPYIFHMSWTHNKENKVKFFQQLGEWYVKEECLVDASGTPSLEALACCSTEALISCHYRDKPSKFPCKDSPPIDEGKPSFW